jgi:hypothetical protein
MHQTVDGTEDLTVLLRLPMCNLGTASRQGEKGTKWEEVGAEGTDDGKARCVKSKQCRTLCSVTRLALYFDIHYLVALDLQPALDRVVASRGQTRRYE